MKTLIGYISATDFVVCLRCATPWIRQMWTALYTGEAQTCHQCGGRI